MNIARYAPTALNSVTFLTHNEQITQTPLITIYLIRNAKFEEMYVGHVVFYKTSHTKDTKLMMMAFEWYSTAVVVP